MTEASNQRLRVDRHTLGGTNWGKVAVRAGIAVLLLVGGGVIALVGQGLLGGGQGANETRVYTYQDDWRIVCPPVTPATPNCELTSQVTNSTTGGVLLTLSVVESAQQGTQLSLTVPFGVMLDPGLGFTIGMEPTRVRPYETCAAQGCFALVTMDADTLKSLNSNMGGQVAVAVPNNPQAVAIPFSLRGFAQGYNELQRFKSRRNGLFSFLRG